MKAARIRSFVYIHQEIHAPKLLHAGIHRLLQTLKTPHVHTAQPKYLRSLSRGRDVLRNAVGLLDVPSDDAGVGAEVDEGADLGGADAAVAAGAEDDFVREDAVFPYVGDVGGFGKGHCEFDGLVDWEVDIEWMWSWSDRRIRNGGDTGSSKEKASIRLL